MELRLRKTQIEVPRWFYTLSQCFVWITILLFNRLAEFWAAYFRVVYFPASTAKNPGWRDPGTSSVWGRFAPAEGRSCSSRTPEFLDSRFADWARTPRKGTNGVSTNGVTANFMFFDRGTFWVLPLTYFHIPKSARAYLFPRSVKIRYFCSQTPISLYPFATTNIPTPITICYHYYYYY